MLRRMITITLAVVVITTLILFVRSAISIDRWVSGLEQEVDFDNKKRVILIAPELNTPYWRVLEEGAREQAEKIEYLLQYMGPQRQNVAEYERVFKKAIASSPDAIIVQGFSGVEELVIQANEANIPVMTVDNDATSSQRFAYVGTDNILAGQQLANLMLESITLPATIGVIMGDHTALNQVTRLEAFQEAIANHPQINIVTIRESNISRYQAAKVTIEMLEEYPNINVLVGLSGLDAIGIVDGLGELKVSDIAVFGFDNLANTENFIQEHKMVGSVVQQPKEIGTRAIHVLQQYFEEQPFDERTFIPTTILTSESMEVQEADHEN